MGNLIDLSGQRYGRLTVIERENNSESGKTRWLCKCDCGNTAIVLQGNLRRLNGTKSCGCLQKETASEIHSSKTGKSFYDLSGQKFGRLTVIKRNEEYVGSDGRHRFKYLCLCDCGNYITVTPHHLKSGGVRSCGCLHKESAAKQGMSNIRHGGNRRNAPYEEKRLYSIWTGMKQRCENPNCSSFPDWGGRGIAVCDEWHDFAKFQNWAMSNGYDKELSIDRIDVNGNYQPNNCRWVTQIVQMNNQRSNRRIEVYGETRTLAEWSRMVGIKPGTIASRIDRGWSPEMAVYTPLKNKTEKT